MLNINDPKNLQISLSFGKCPKKERDPFKLNYFTLKIKKKLKLKFLAKTFTILHLKYIISKQSEIFKKDDKTFQKTNFKQKKTY